MPRVAIAGLDRTLEQPERLTHANFAVVHDGTERTVHVVKRSNGWTVTTQDADGHAGLADTPLDGSFTDAALYGIGLALERPLRPRSL